MLIFGGPLMYASGSLADGVVVAVTIADGVVVAVTVAATAWTVVGAGEAFMGALSLSLGVDGVAVSVFGETVIGVSLSFGWVFDVWWAAEWGWLFVFALACVFSVVFMGVVSSSVTVTALFSGA